MTSPVNPPRPEAPESAVSELHALYRDAAQAEPGATLDRRILEAARAELKAGRATKSRRPTPWWKRWLPVTSAIALALVGLSVTWRVMDEQERDLRQEMKAAQGVRESSTDTAGRAAPAQPVAEAPPLQSAPAPRVENSRRAESAVVLPLAGKGNPRQVENSRRAESAAVKDAAPVAQEPAAFPAPAAPAPIAPVPVEPAAKKGQRLEMDEVRERRDPGAAADPASAPSRQVGKLEAGSAGVGSGSETAADALAKPSANLTGRSVATAVAQPAADPATPEAWLKQIRELRAAGRSAEAAQSLTRFRARYPDLVLPDDLLNLK